MVRQINGETVTETLAKRLRKLPSVDALLTMPQSVKLIDNYGRPLALEAIRQTLERWRVRIQAGEDTPNDETILEMTHEWLADFSRPTLVPVINATGVIIHTNLGRAPLSQPAIDVIRGIGRTYSNLEFDLTHGERGKREVHAERLLTRLTGAEAGLVVNNNAAAVLLMLTALCQGREVVISRGQLVEIGGGFRVPDVMAQSGAKLVEVGTTNRTHLRDYAEAINDNTAAILVAHHSNFKLIGFTSEPAMDELAELAHRNNIQLLFDQGSGAIYDTSTYGLDFELTVPESLQLGVDIVAFSGDKLIGGPQSGILVGRQELLATMKSHPLARAVRADKLCLAALSATLLSYLTNHATRDIPIWQMISASQDDIHARALCWVDRLSEGGIPATILPGFSTVGGGSLPGTTLATTLVALDYDRADILARVLRVQTPPVVGRIVKEKLVLDPRTVLPDQDDALISAIMAGIQPTGSSEHGN